MASVESRLARLERAGSADLVPAQPKTKPPTPLAFIESLQIADRATGGLIPFRLYPAQRHMLKAMVASDRLVIVKSRQLGCSWLALAYMLYLATFEESQLFIVARQSLEEAGEGIARLGTMNDSVPERWRREATTDNVFSLGLTSDCRIRALSSTKSIGRGLASRYCIADELAWWLAPESQLAALEPGAQRLHVISTGAGPHDALHRLWLGSLSPESPWRGEFYPWTSVPGRDASWYRANVDLAPSPSLAAREHASSPEQAFQAPGGRWAERFDSTRNVDDIAPVPEWDTVRGIDWGYHSPAAVWVQLSPAGQPFIVHEYRPHDLVTNEFVAGIVREDAKLGLVTPPRISYVDPAGAAVNVQIATPEVEAARRCGLNPVFRHSLVREGCTRMTNALADPEIPLIVSTCCPFTIEALSSAKVDKNHEGEYAKDGYYEHLLDAARYVFLHLNLGPVEPYVAPPLGNSPIGSELRGLFGRYTPASELPF
jgi:hypothetical protein